MSDRVHHFEHHVNWSHVVLGLVLLVAALEFGDTLVDIAADSDMDARDGAEAAASVMTN